MNKGGDLLWCLALFVMIPMLLIGCGGKIDSETGGTNQPLASELGFLSNPPTQATEGTSYVYTLSANIQGAVFVLTSAPVGAALSGNTVRWTPTSPQSRAMNQFTVTATYSGVTKTQNWTVTPTGTIRGTTAGTCFSDSGQQTVSFFAFDAIGSQVQVLVPNASGAFDTYTGAIALDGTFSIPNVPAGSFWLSVLFTKLWTSSSTINLGSRFWGGCNQETRSSPGTSLQVAVNGLDPWLSSDYFDFGVPNARSGGIGVQLPSSGGTSLTVNVPSNNLLLFNAANGDNAYFAQLVNASYAGIPFQTLQQYFGPMPVTVQNGVVNPFTVTLQPQLKTSAIRANVKGSAFTALYPTMSRNATPVSPGDNFRVDISPTGSGPSAFGLFLVLASHAFSSDFDAGDIAFANPFPAAWTPYLDYSDIAMQQLTPPGASSPFSMVLFNRVITNDFPAAGKPIAPLVGPALNPQINGVSLFQDQFISGAMPTLSWQPPSLGSAYIYFIQVQQFVVTNGVPSLQLKGQLYSTNTSLAIPSGLLSSGNSYCFVIESLYRSSPAPSGIVAPFMETIPQGQADLVSGVISVQ